MKSVKKEKSAKKIINSVMFIFVFCFSLCLGASNLGLKFGPLHSDLSGGDFSLGSYKIGIFCHIDLNDRFGVQPAVYFSQMGNKKEPFIYYDTQDKLQSLKTWEYNDKLSYLELPVLITYQISLGKGFKPKIFIGPYAAVRLSHTLTETDIKKEVAPSFFEPWSENENDYHVNVGFWRDKEVVYYSHLQGKIDNEDINVQYIHPPYADMDAGIITGFGFSLGSSQVKYILECQINFGFVNIYQPGNQNFSKRNHNLSILFGIAF